MANSKELENLVEQYFDVDARIKELEAKKKPLNQQIKDSMRQLGLKDLHVGTLKVTFGVQQRTDMNEPMLLRRLKELGLTNAIKLVEAPDQEVIESLLYKGELAPSTLADCTTTKVIETLTIKEVKGK